MKCLFPLLLTVFLVVMVKRIYGEELPIEKVLDGVTKKERIEEARQWLKDLYEFTEKKEPAETRDKMLKGLAHLTESLETLQETYEEDLRRNRARRLQ